MSWRIVYLDDVLPVPWRNGGGVTRELVAWPGADDWIWRMSVAEVAQSGPFSCYAGVQRWFAVLAGAGVRLQMPDQNHTLTAASAPLCFDGTAAVNCQLLAGATQDFNLMLRRDRAAAQMTRVSGAASFVLAAPKTVAVYAISSETSLQLAHESITLAAHSLAWQALAAGATLQLSAADALWMEIDV